MHRWAVGFDGLMGGDQSGPRRRGRRADRPRGDGHAEAGQDRGAAGEAQPEPVVQPQPGGLGPRAELGPRRAQGIGGLLGVTALNAATTPAAAGYPHPEPGHHWTNRGQLGLELISPPLEVDPVTAVGATAPQWGIHGPVRVRGGHPVTMTAMGVAGLATRAGRIVLGAPFENGAAWRLPDRRTCPSCSSSSVMRASRVATCSPRSATAASRRATTASNSATRPAPRLTPETAHEHARPGGPRYPSTTATDCPRPPRSGWVGPRIPK